MKYINLSGVQAARILCLDIAVGIGKMVAYFITTCTYIIF